jgi:hypothetical protein
LASTPCTWSFSEARVDQLVPAAADLPQLADLARGDPRLGQPAHPQQAGQVRGVPFVFSEQCKPSCKVGMS